METAGRATLSQQPEIIELFQLLGKSGMTEEFQKVNFLVEYLETMEQQFGQVLENLEKMNTQLMQIENRGAYTAVSRMTDGVGDKMHEIGNQLILVKNHFIQFAKDTKKIFQEKGKDALRNAVTMMKISSILFALEKSFHSGVECMDKNAKKVQTISNEFHAIGGHIGNIGRTLIGKERKDSVQEKADKGVLTKVQKIFLICGNIFSNMEKQTKGMAKQVEQFRNSGEKKKSVKEELRRIKSEKSEKSAMLPTIQDKAR